MGSHKKRGLITVISLQFVDKVVFFKKKAPLFSFRSDADMNR